MPTYNVKPYKHDGPAMVGAIGKEKEHYPSVHIDVSPEIIRALEVGQEATVTLTGTIVGLSENRNERNSRCHLELEMRKVEAYPTKKEKTAQYTEE